MAENRDQKQEAKSTKAPSTVTVEFTRAVPPSMLDSSQLTGDRIEAGTKQEVSASVAKRLIKGKVAKEV